MWAKRGAGLVLVAAFSSVLGGCGSGGANLIVPPPEANPVAEEQSGVDPGQPQLYGYGSIVCLDQPGSVHVENIRPVAPTGGMHVQAFILQKNPWAAGRTSIGAQSGTLEHAGVMKDDVGALTAVCNSKTASGYEPVVQIAYTSGRVGHADGFEMDYISDGQRKKLFIAMAVTLCAGQGHEPQCERVDWRMHPALQLASEAAAQH